MTHSTYRVERDERTMTRSQAVPLLLREMPTQGHEHALRDETAILLTRMSVEAASCAGKHTASSKHPWATTVPSGGPHSARRGQCAGGLQCPAEAIPSMMSLFQHPLLHTTVLIGSIVPHGRQRLAWLHC